MILILSAVSARAQDAGVAAEVIVNPTAQCAGSPPYPSSEKASGVRGVVVLRVTLSGTGAVTALEVGPGLGSAFDQAALESAKECHFTGASRGGVPVPAIIELSVEFTPPVEPWVLEGVVVGELGEPLSGAEIRFGGQAAIANGKGRFHLEYDAVPAGDAWVMVSNEGFANKGFPEVFRAGQTTRVKYVLLKQKVGETRIEGSRLLETLPDVDHTPQVSRFTITRADIDKNPGALEDIARVVQQIPGVAADPDLLATFFVRGGGPEEVVFYLDGVPLTNPYHLGGFASIFNPMMIDSADFFAGGIPARYEPALSGAFEVKYATGETNKPKLWADLSMLTAKMRADVPMGQEGLSATISLRRSYLEAYFAVLAAFKIFGSNVVAPDITELLARVNYHHGNHTTTASVIYAADGLNFVIKPGEQVLVNFQGGLAISNVSQLLILQHKIALAGDSGLEFTAAYTRDTNSISVDSTLPFSNDARREDGLVRGDLKWSWSDHNRSAAGFQFAHRFLGLLGKVVDSRDVAPWINEPFVQTYSPYLEIAPNVTRNLVSAYAEHTWRPIEAFSVEGGGRAQFDLSSEQWSGSARLGAAVTLPKIATVLKASVGIAAQPSLIPLYLDPKVGNPHLLPERSWTGIIGLEQPLPFEAFLRLEGWVKYLDRLVVNPDSPQKLAQIEAAGGQVFSNLGTGLAKGVDLLFLGRTRYFSYGASAALLFADRHNPLATGVQDYPAPWDQRFTLAAHVSFSPNNKWLFTARTSISTPDPSARFNFRTGRPYTPVLGFVKTNPGERCPDGCFVPVFADTNSARYPGFYEISARAERRFRLGPLDMAAYLEVMNLTNSTNLFARIYDTGDYAAGTEPKSGAFNHLPIRPFLGVRAEY